LAAARPVCYHQAKLKEPAMTRLRPFAPLALIATLAMTAACGQGGSSYGPGYGFAGSGIGTEAIGVSVFGAGVSETVLFVVDSSELTPAARETLVAQAAWFAANPQATAVIEGHADERGTREYNLGLSAQSRASAVRRPFWC
jgi:peptidoglycan-associated lipoprotein